ncbi:MAG: aminopeptidase P family protein [Clostridium sp.]
MNNIANLREIMLKNNMDYYIIPSSDPHQSEYVEEYYKGRAYISGFTGSAGTLLVGKEKSKLWTDGRYFIQAANELSSSGIDLMKMRNPGVETLEEWISKNIKTSETLGFDGRVISTNQYKELLQISLKNNFKIQMENDLLVDCWNERPSLSKEEIFIHEIEFAGKSAGEKIKEVRNEMNKCKANSYIITTLDDIAWLFNIRGNDITFNPVAVAYALITNEKANLYIDKDKVNDETLKVLKSEGIDVYSYEDIEKDVEAIKESVVIDPQKVSAKLYSLINKKVKITEKVNITTILKAMKNNVEIANTENSQVRDGVAMVKFIKWLKENISKEEITEISASDEVLGFRAEGDNFKGPSFGTIAGYKDHAAMMHYSATEESEYTLKPEGMLLLDSGGQYLDGTTDITRTFILGSVTEEEKRDFTLVLKGHIALSKAKFLKGTTGMNLDILARQPMWQYGMDYKCGTGHGVGYFLNVHEGPQGFRQEGNTTVLEEGMIITNEPGIYKEGKHGIRIENTLLVVKDVMSKEFGEFYKFQTISYCPIDLNGVVVEMLESNEKDWLNNYHETVFNKISPFLNDEEVNFLKEQTRSI